MATNFDRIERVLKLESDQGFQDKAVVGGIRQFAAYWVGDAREEASGEGEKALVEQVAQVLTDYSRLPGREARKEAIESVLQKLKAHREGLQEAPRPSSQPVKEQAPPEAAPVEKPAQEQPRRRPEVEVQEAEPDPEGLKQGVPAIKGVGPKVAQLLERLGVKTIWDLLYLFPRRYDDYTQLRPVSQLRYGEKVTIIGTVWETRARRTRNGQLVQTVISDGSGTIQATWFNQPWLANQVKAGMRVVLSGSVDQFLGRLVMQNPEWERLELEPLRTRRIVPVYPLTQGLSAHRLRQITKNAVDQWAKHVPDPLPEAIREKHDFFALPTALYQAHFPESQECLHHARRRLAFDELFMLQLGMLGFRRDWQSAPGVALPADRDALNELAATLPFKLTGAQVRVIREIAADMAGPLPMNRLLQGDVGSGKTVVAAAAIVLATRAGFQAALMAPTEILAEQHYGGLKSLLGKLGIQVNVLTGSTPATERESLAAQMRDGTAQVVVGTHALIQEGVRFKNLALAIVDEQHRFGVEQRKALRQKGVPASDNGEHPSPHLLVMSATPIPRTLALSLYGDLDLSTLDEMPPGRQEIKTNWLRPGARERAYAFVRGQIEQGRQAFVICPLVEDSEKSEDKSAVAEHERLQSKVFPDLKLGLLHGRMKGHEKEDVMRAFYNGDIDILVATSVIEVGIDVPNSTVMLIEGANRFGLAQLHQFRGRVGRGEHQSYCLLLADSVSEDAEARLAALEKTNDGFVLAEKDLELRGPGEFFGRRQSGLPELRLASLTDMDLLALAREEAQALFEHDPELTQPEHELLKDYVADFWASAGDVS